MTFTDLVVLPDPRLSARRGLHPKSGRAHSGKLVGVELGAVVGRVKFRLVSSFSLQLTMSQSQGLPGSWEDLN